MIEQYEYKGEHWWVNVDRGDHKMLGENDYKDLPLLTTDIWMDAGANIGTFAFRQSAKVDCVIHSYEPDPQTAEVFKLNQTLFPTAKVFFHQVALGISDGEIPFYQANMSASSSALPCKGRNKVMVKLVDIDKEILRINANKLKLDIEGGELQIFLNSKLPNIEYMIFEWHPRYTDKIPHRQSVLFEQVIDRLMRLGFDDFTHIKTVTMYGGKEGGAIYSTTRKLFNDVPKSTCFI